MIYFEKFSNTSYQIMRIINYILKDFTIYIYIINKDTRGGICEKNLFWVHFRPFQKVFDERM